MNRLIYRGHGAGPDICRRRVMAAALGICLATAGLAAPASARAPDQLTGYGKLLFGMTTAEVEALTGRPARLRPDGVAVIETSEKVAGMPADRALLLPDGRLSSILFTWDLDDSRRSTPAACQGLFDRLLGQITGRYGNPAIGPDSSAGDGIGPGFAGTSFWSFPDGASIALVAREGAAAAESPAGPGCRATVNYKEPPADDPTADDPTADDAMAGDPADDRTATP